MICPKCGFEQPDNLECMRCGVIISRYKGPVVGAAARPAVAAPVASFGAAPSVAPAAPAAMAARGVGGSLYDGPEPAMATAGGTLYDDRQLPVAEGGGTMFTGTMSAGPIATQARLAFKGSLGVGKILGESFSIYFRNFIPFVLLTAVALSPLYLAQAYMTAAQQTSPMAIVSGLFFLASFFLCPYIATAAITFGVFQQMRGRDTSIGDCLGRGFSSLFPVLGLAIVQGFRITLGYFLCIVPGVIWTLQLAVSIPAAVEEGTGISESMERSKFLTDGLRGEVFGILFVLGFLNFGSTAVLILAAPKDESLLLLFSGMKDLLYVGLSATATAVMYYRLRSIKESIDVDQIASVFA